MPAVKCRPAALAFSADLRPGAWLSSRLETSLFVNDYGVLTPAAWFLGVIASLDARRHA